MKRHVVCIDGTWNQPGQIDADPGEKVVTESETNVLRMYRFLTRVMHEGQPIQVGQPVHLLGDVSGKTGWAMYLTGVGSSGSRLAKAWSGATGTGTSERVMEVYRFLASVHEPGDQIFVFGFSRGAFAARSLAGFLECVGLPATPRFLSDDELNETYRVYRERKSSQRAAAIERRAEVDFLGVWDTVGALAFGVPTARWHNISPANVKRVAHALALDEVRSTFKPEYWEGSNPAAIVDEVWFLGAHSNVGGGYANKELSNIALAWMASEAVDAGLPTDKQYVDGWYIENSMGKTRDSHKEFLRWMGPLHSLLVGSCSRTVLPHQRFHATVFERIGNKETSSYAPAASLHDGQPFPNSVTLVPKERVVETPDYLTP